jgi:hypothetical protein
MKIISHRGNIKGIKSERENSPSYIDSAIKCGLDVEVDIRYLNGKFLLGHDRGDYLVSEQWILKRKENIWFHCKNLAASHELEKLDKQIIKFCHSSDPYILTSNGYIWVHDIQQELNTSCVIPLMSEEDISSFDKQIVHAVCTDNTDFCKYNFKNKGLY